MRYLPILAFFALNCTTAAATPPQDDPGLNLPLETFTLDNGMRVLVVPRREVPRVYCSLWWRVGSVHERPGITGLSHFFEHMMFMGTKRIGTTDSKKDAELNAKIDSIMGGIRTLKLARLEARRRGETPDPEGEARHKQLRAEYEALVEEQKTISIPEHLAKIYQSQGGIRLNATTSYDRTNYFVELPANKVELFFWLEADRFGGPVLRSFYPEREVVKEERRRSRETTPTGLIDEAYLSLFWQSHPYGWPVIGWMSDIDQYTVNDAQRYYDTHYSPDNCTAIFVGDVDTQHIRNLARRYFGQLKRFPNGRPPIVTQESVQTAVRRIDAEADARETVQVRWHGPSGVHKDSPACDLLMALFKGRSGRLYRPLVEEREIALDVESWYWSLRYGGVMHLGITPAPGTDYREIETALHDIVEKIRHEGITERELKKVKNQLLADLVRGLTTSHGITRQLGYFETIGTHEDFPRYLKHLQNVTVEDIQRCALDYLKPEGRNILTLRRRKPQ